MHVAVVFEGVLVKPGEQAPIHAGVDLARSLAPMDRLVVLSEASVEAVERFLGVHRVEKVAKILSGSERPGEAPLVQRQVEEYRAGGVRLDAVVYPDPALTAWILESRLAAILFLPPGSIPPRFRPDDDAGRPTWDEINLALERR